MPASISAGWCHEKMMCETRASAAAQSVVGQPSHVRKRYVGDDLQLGEASRCGTGAMDDQDVGAGRFSALVVGVHRNAPARRRRLGGDRFFYVQSMLGQPPSGFARASPT